VVIVMHSNLKATQHQNNWSSQRTFRISDIMPHFEIRAP